MSLITLPTELLMLISDWLEIEDIYNFFIICQTLYRVLEHRLYQRAVKDERCKDQFLYAAIYGRATAVTNFLRAGLQMNLFKEYKSPNKRYRYHTHDSSLTRVGYCVSIAQREVSHKKFHPLLAAAFSGHVNVVKALLHEGQIDVDTQDRWKKTALCYAIEDSRFDVVKFLLEEGAKVIDDHQLGQDFCGSPFICAAKCDNKEMLHILLKELRRRSTPENDILSQCRLASAEACTKGFNDSLRLLLRHGVDVNTPIQGRTLLYYASTTAHLSTVKLLVKEGAKMENEKDTGIMKTFHQFLRWYDKYENDYVDIIQYLLEAGCDVASGGLHACALWYATDMQSNIKRKERGVWKDELEKMRDTMLQRGFDKAKCRNGCWKDDRYQLGSWFLTERFFDCLVEDHGSDEVAFDPRDRAARHHWTKN